MSDLISLPQLSAARSLFSFQSAFFYVSLSQSQFQKLINQNQKLMNCIHQLKTLRRISHASATSHISAISHISTKLTSVLNFLVRCDNDSFFMSNPFIKHDIILFSSVRVTNTENDKVEVNSFFIFKLSENIQLWILEVNDYFNLHKITDLNTQATVAVKCTSES